MRCGKLADGMMTTSIMLQWPSAMVFASVTVEYCTNVDGQRRKGIAKVMKIFYIDEDANSIKLYDHCLCDSRLG